MISSTIESDFKKSVCAEVRLHPEGMDRFRVFTPYMFDDGDHFVIVLKKWNDSWVVTDEGHTYMRLTYTMEAKDLQKGIRHSIISNVLDSFSIVDRDGALAVNCVPGQFGNALYSLIQGIFKISDVSYLKRELVKSTFMEDFKSFMLEAFQEPQVQFNWISQEHDPSGMYPVDCRVATEGVPLFIYALGSDDKVKDATINFNEFEKWAIPHHSIGIFEDQETINRKVLARFTNVCDRQFSSLTTSHDRILKYMREHAASVNN